MTPFRPLQTASDGHFAPPADGFVHISPPGRYPFRLSDGQTVEMEIDAEACRRQVATFRSDAAAAGEAWGGLLVDFDHFSLDHGRSSEAAGWVEDLDARDDGLWARVRWSDSGLAAIAGGRFRYASPVHMPSDCAHSQGAAVGLRPSRLFRLALTNDPRMIQGAERMRPISSRQEASASDASETPPAPGGKKGPPPMDYKAMLLELLGLPAEATDEDVSTALASRKEAAVASEAEEAEKEKALAALASRAETAEKALAELRADAALDALVRDGYAIASRDTARLALIADHDRTLAAIRAFRPAPKAVGEPLRSRRDAATPGGGGSTPATRNDAVEAEMRKHNFRRRADAVASAMRAYPDLWKTE